MRVKSKNLLYNFLPDAKSKKKILADMGAEVPPNPYMNLKNIPADYFDHLEKAAMPQIQPTGANFGGDPANIMDKMMQNPANMYPSPGVQVQQHQQNYHPYTGQYGKMATTAIGLADALIPYPNVRKNTVTSPLEIYNPHAYGTGSQALEYGGIVGNPQYERDYPIVIPEGSEDNSPSAKSGIHINPKNKGKFNALKKRTGKTTEQLKHSKNPLTRKRATFAANAKKWHHEDGGEIEAMPMGGSLAGMSGMMYGRTSGVGDTDPKKYNSFGGIITDNMSNFSPHRYEQGGLVPQTNLLEQYLPWDTGEYANGGTLPDLLQGLMSRPNQRDMAYNGQNIPNMLEKLVFHPNEADMAKSGKQVSSAKAKEILRDGTAQGHKLTAKQKRYFGWIAGGSKAPGGTQIPDPLSTTNGQNFSGVDMSTKKADLSELLSYNLVNKGKPEEINNYRRAFLRSATDILGEDKGRKLFDNVQIYNQRPELKGKSPEDIINSYYNSTSNDPDVKDFKDHYRNYGGSPVNLYRNSPEVGVEEQRKMPVLHYADGGIMYDDGGQVQTMWGGNVEQMSNNPHDGGVLKFNGDSHDEGGIGMHYNGKPVEVEGGETAAKDAKGNLNIFGNMYLPGTRNKFKDVMKEIGEKEKRYDFLKTKGTELVNNSDISNKFEKLTFNSGQVMMQGGSMGQKDLADKKQKLADLQKAMLDTASEHGIDAQEMSKGRIKKAKQGAIIPIADNGAEVDQGPGKPKKRPAVIADPGQDDDFIRSIKKGIGGAESSNRYDVPARGGSSAFGKYQMTKATRQDLYNKYYKSSFKNFDDFDSAFKKTPDLQEDAMSTRINELRGKYGDNPTAITLVHRLGEGGYNKTLKDPSLLNKSVSTSVPQSNDKETPAQYLDKVGFKLPGVTYRPQPTKEDAPPQFTPYNLPGTPALTENQPKQVTPVTATPPADTLQQVPDRQPLPTQAKPLDFGNVAGEIFAAATNRERPVFAQKYQPQLYSPYEVSFQDRLNNNQNTFNALQRQLGTSNPSALGALAAQKYGADSGVKAEEFRTNQGIANDIINKNVNTNNDALLKNLAAADTQFTRQETANSKTRELNQMIVNSLSSKYSQNQLENNRLKAYENLYDFRLDPNQKGGLSEHYYGPDASFQYSGRPNPYGQGAGGERSATRYDQYGNIKGVTEYKDNELMDRYRELEIERQRRKLPLLTAAPLE